MFKLFQFKSRFDDNKSFLQFRKQTKITVDNFSIWHFILLPNLNDYFIPWPSVQKKIYLIRTGLR